MDLVEKAKAVAVVLHDLDEEIKKFQSWSLLGCAFGCGKCCLKPDIEATPLEFLPLALKIFQEGKADWWLDRFEKRPDEKICMVLDPKQLGVGLCSQYEHRGMICRLFGYSARLNKYNKKELITCKVIKTEQIENYMSASLKINADGEVPIMSDFYLKLHCIDPLLANEFMPVNNAILRALELIGQYFSYRKQET